MCVLGSPWALPTVPEYREILISIAVCAATRADRESQQKSQEGHAEDTVPAVTHIRLKMKVAPASRSGGGALMIYDVAINARDPSARQDH